MYRIGPSVNHRKEHESWDGLILPKTGPWRDSRLPPNGWGCKCCTRAVSEARLKKYKEQGVNVPPSSDGALHGSGGGGTPEVKTEAPPVNYTTYFNERKGTVEKVPDGVDPAFNWNPGKAGANAAAQKLAESTKNYEAAASAKPKKDYLTKKKLEADIAALDAQMKGAGKEQAAALEAKKAEAQKLLDKKQSAGEIKTLAKQQTALQKKLDGIPVKTCFGIWKGEITTADWAEKSGSIEAKKEYFKYKLSEGVISDADKIKFEQFIKDLDEFDAEGRAYHGIQAEPGKVKNRLAELKQSGK
jgi:hypothetical protein